MTDGSRIALVEEWMQDKEGENLEFKSARGGFHSETLAKYCCALANEGGGRIILGVTDARPRQFVGTKAFDQPERTRKGFFCYYDELWNQINLRNDKQDFQEGLFVTPISTFNERPVREAILNAVSHRNYQLGGSIFIRQFPRRLEIDSPGGLPLGITLENILDRQNPRNRRVAEILTRCGLVERSGQGINLIYEELIKQSKPAPDFSRTNQYQVGLTLHGTVEDPAFVRLVEKVSRETTTSLKRRDEAYSVGRSLGAKWFPRSSPASTATRSKRRSLKISPATSISVGCWNVRGTECPTEASSFVWHSSSPQPG